MSRLCIVGSGTPAFIDAAVHHGPGLRTAHFTTALARAGHEVLVLYVGGGNGAELLPMLETAAGDRLGAKCVAVSEGDFGRAKLREMVERFDPDAMVGAGAPASALAARLGLDLPLWADIFGDPMAEAQAKAASQGNDACLPRFWSMLGPVLERADRFSAVSEAQAHALVGQLGLGGRLSRLTAGERLVDVIPCAAEAAGEGGTRERAPLALPRGAFVVLSSGSYNTWCDVETLFHGLDAAMSANPDIHFVSSGGGVAGHDENSYANFCRMVSASRHSSRFHLLGWLDSDLMAGLYALADVGLVVERDLYERRLGSENRVVQWMVHGLPCLTTGLSEFGASLVGGGLAFGCASGDPGALAATLAGLARDRRPVAAAGAACRREAALRYDYQSTAGPLLDWCRQPLRARDARGARPLSLGLFSEPAAVVHLLEAYLAGLSLGQLGYRSLRWFSRRLSGRGLRRPGCD